MINLNDLTAFNGQFSGVEALSQHIGIIRAMLPKNDTPTEAVTPLESWANHLYIEEAKRRLVALEAYLDSEISADEFLDVVDATMYGVGGRI